MQIKIYSLGGIPSIPRLYFSPLPKKCKTAPRNPWYFYSYHTEERTVGFATLYFDFSHRLTSFQLLPNVPIKAYEALLVFSHSG